MTLMSPLICPRRAMTVAGGNLPTMPEIPEIDVAELVAAREAGVVLIDVREPEEYSSAHVPGAVLIPLGQVTDRVSEVPTEGTVYIICASGGRSARAAGYLRQQGIDAVNVAGGTLAWIDAGHPTDSGVGSGTTPE